MRDTVIQKPPVSARARAAGDRMRNSALAALGPKLLALLEGWALPKSRVNLTRIRWVFAPFSPLGATAGGGHG
jgi:hypothetical protein